jgi:hypothetical protein
MAREDRYGMSTEAVLISPIMHSQLMPSEKRLGFLGINKTIFIIYKPYECPINIFIT